MRPIILAGAARKAWEESVINDDRIEKPTDAFLMRTLLDFCGGKATCWPGVKTIAGRMRLGERSVQLAIGRCVSLGVLERADGCYVILSHPDASRICGVEVIPIERPRRMTDAERHSWWADQYRRQRDRNRRTAGLA